MVAYHVIFGAYGFWLPNDPRGSWSDFVGSWELFRFGHATKTDETQSVAHRDHDRYLRLATKASLKYPAVAFDDIQTRTIGDGFADYAKRAELAVWACAIMPDHVHLVLARHRLKIEPLVIQLKGHATRALIENGVHPFGDIAKPAPKCFARGEWKVYLEPDEVHRAIRYVENNPVKEGKPQQHWPFVAPSPFSRDAESS